MVELGLDNIWVAGGLFGFFTVCLIVGIVALVVALSKADATTTGEGHSQHRLRQETASASKSTAGAKVFQTALANPFTFNNWVITYPSNFTPNWSPDLGQACMTDPDPAHFVPSYNQPLPYPGGLAYAGTLAGTGTFSIQVGGTAGATKPLNLVAHGWIMPYVTAAQRVEGDGKMLLGNLAGQGTMEVDGVTYYSRSSTVYGMQPSKRRGLNQGDTVTFTPWVNAVGQVPDFSAFPLVLVVCGVGRPSNFLYGGY